MNEHEVWIESADGQRRPVAATCSVGRSNSNDLVIDDGHVSRRHALIHKQDSAEYWVIDRFRRIMTVYRPGPIGPVHQVVLESQAYETPLLPGFVLPLARIFGAADRLKKPPKSPKLDR